MARQSAQLDEWAASRDRDALRSPNPPNINGSVVALFTEECATAGVDTQDSPEALQHGSIVIRSKGARQPWAHCSQPIFAAGPPAEQEHQPSRLRVRHLHRTWCSSLLVDNRAVTKASCPMCDPNTVIPCKCAGKSGSPLPDRCVEVHNECSSGQLIAPCWSLAVAIPDLCLPVVHRDGRTGLQLLLEDLVECQYYFRRADRVNIIQKRRHQLPWNQPPARRHQCSVQTQAEEQKVPSFL